MDKDELQRARADAKARLDARIRRAYEDYQAELDSLFDLFFKGESTGVQRSRKPRTTNIEGHSGGIADAIRLVIPSLPKRFTIVDVERELKDQHKEVARRLKKSTLSSAMRRVMGTTPGIEVARKGKGRRATQYRKSNVAE